MLDIGVYKDWLSLLAGTPGNVFLSIMTTPNGYPGKNLCSRISCKFASK